MLCRPSCLYQASHSLTPALSPQPANLECSTEDKLVWLLCRSLRRRITNPNWCFLLHIWHQNIHCSFTTLPWCTDWHNFFPAPTPCCKKKKKYLRCLVFCYDGPGKRIHFTSPFTLIVDWKTCGQLGHCLQEPLHETEGERGLSGNLGSPRTTI